MKRTILILMAVIALANNMSASNILVTYFSWGNNTKALAEEIQRQTNADIYRIEPLVPYTTDYTELAYTISVREKENNERPALSETDQDFSKYDYIFVGCPVWWFDAPMIMHTFLETYDFSGKTIIPFCTYYTAEYQTLNDIINATPNSNHLKGYSCSGASSYNSSVIQAWLDEIGIFEISGVSTVQADALNNTNQPIYNLNGQKIASSSDVTNLSSGLYITNGKKIVIK
jgi:flavodoxin